MGRILLIVNPVAGGKDKQNIVRLAGEILGKPDVVYTTHAGHATALAGKTDAEVVVAVGGAGTVSEVARGLAGSSK
ncbi:MAG: acylglycerol kinase family protein, partial [Bacteroidales bacterium]|nr:acylglycerol kinase family protein [Bacteroidales bacterium]